jgi:hypothetical protein
MSNHIDNTLPNDFRHLLTQQEYEQVLGLALDYFAERNFPVVEVTDGVIVVDYEDLKDMRFGLDNLVRTIAGEEPAEWPGLIRQHFERFQNHTLAYNYLFADLGYARQFLRVLIKGEHFGAKGIKLVRRRDFPETYTFLVIDFANQFRFVNEEDAAQWEVPTEELFQMALANVAAEKVEIGQGKIADQYPLFTFFSSDFAASYLVDFEKNVDFCLGEFGALVAIPAKGSAFVHPIEDLTAMTVLEILAPLVVKFCEEEPGGINMNFYWYWQGRFELFPRSEVNGRSFNISAPPALIGLLSLSNN